MKWAKDLRSALARWISPPITKTSTVYSEAEIIESLSEMLTEKDSFRLVLHIERDGKVHETDVMTMNYYQMPETYYTAIH